MIIACCTTSPQVRLNVEQVLAKLSLNLTCEHFDADIVLLQAVTIRTFDLVIADVNGASETAPLYSWLKTREQGCCPVLVLSSMGDPAQMAYALDAGADDFIGNAACTAELEARMMAVVRRRLPNGARIIELAGYVLDRHAHTLKDRGRSVRLTPKEFALACLLFSAPGRFFSYQHIATVIWGGDTSAGSHSVEQHIFMLRKKLHLSDKRGLTIRTLYAQGYRLEVTQIDGSLATVPAAKPCVSSRTAMR